MGFNRRIFLLPIFATNETTASWSALEYTSDKFELTGSEKVCTRMRRSPSHNQMQTILLFFYTLLLLEV